jgi:hypothetical protein
LSIVGAASLVGVPPNVPSNGVVIIPFDPVVFRAKFKAFANANCYSNDELQGWWDTATVYISDVASPCSVLTLAQQTQALYLMTAHQGAIWDALANGTPLSMVTDAQVDKVRVTVKPPPVQENSQFQWWLGLTPYGQAILALFGIASAGGFYIGGLPERDAFRRVGGGFGGVSPRGRCW